MTFPQTLKAYLMADATLTAILTGGVFVWDDLGREGLTPSNIQREADGVRIKPTAVIRMRGSQPQADAPVSDPPAEGQFFDVWFYGESDAVVSQAARRCKVLLNRRVVGVTNEPRGLNYVMWVDDTGEFTADELEGAPANRSRYSVVFTRR